MLRVVLPGDHVVTNAGTSNIDGGADAPALRLGPGLVPSDGNSTDTTAATTTTSSTTTTTTGLVISACKAGLLRHKEPASYWVDSSQKRAVAVQGEQVIGIVTGAPGENFNVDIGINQTAVLPGLSFAGATRRNRPRLFAGDLVYARLSLADKDVEPELTCVNAAGKSAGMGPLEGGHLFTCSTGLCRKLLRPGCPVLRHLGESVKFEMAVGTNGRVWVSAPTTHLTMLVANAIQASELMTPKQTSHLVARLLRGGT